jgi:hypothetical protein
MSAINPISNTFLQLDLLPSRPKSAPDPLSSKQGPFEARPSPQIDAESHKLVILQPPPIKTYSKPEHLQLPVNTPKQEQKSSEDVIIANSECVLMQKNC